MTIFQFKSLTPPILIQSRYIPDISIHEVKLEPDLCKLKSYSLVAPE